LCCDTSSREKGDGRLLKQVWLGEQEAMHVLMIVFTIGWFALVGLLWYARPSDLQWLLGSTVLGVVYFAAFWWYVTRPK
jgi:hypothetical protein